eukprot:scaffold10596_cov16-Cyclotella_meneghiniana.AAC.1
MRTSRGVSRGLLMHRVLVGWRQLTNEAKKIRKLDEVREGLINGDNHWYCFKCNTNVSGLLDACGVCAEFIPFVPLTIDEFTSWVKRNNTNRHKDEEDESVFEFGDAPMEEDSDDDAPMDEDSDNGRMGFSAGERVQVKDKNGDFWKATIKTGKVNEKQKIQIHYDGLRKTTLYWVSVDYVYAIQKEAATSTDEESTQKNESTEEATTSASADQAQKETAKAATSTEEASTQKNESTEETTTS